MKWFIVLFGRHVLFLATSVTKRAAIVLKLFMTWSFHMAIGPHGSLTGVTASHISMIFVFILTKYSNPQISFKKISVS
jgi:hypothetical protein